MSAHVRSAANCTRNIFGSGFSVGTKPMSQPDYIHDIFISYSLTEQNWVRDELLQQLSQAGFTVIADHRDFAIGASWLGYNEHPIWRSRVVVLVLSSRTNGDKRAHFEALLAGLAERTGHAPRALALLLEPCELSERLALLKPINLTNPALRSRQMRRLLRALDDKRLVFISYQRGAEPDESLARQLAAHLGRAGHQVFIDQAMAVSMGLAAQIQRPVEASDYLVVLLSAASTQSEMVADEIAFAYQRFQENSGRPRILPVRVNYHDALPYQIGMYLDLLPLAEWRVPADTR